MGTISMDDIYDKENVSPIDQRDRPKSLSHATPSPAKRKPRSRSLGLGDLDAQFIAHKRLSPERNRRKSAFPKSNLPSKEEEAARRAARRKSLANRRVSFAPEATLHTWDVVEYMRDATSSTASSDERRDSRSAPWPTGPDEEELELPTQESPSQSSDKQKRRRSSVIPPMNFNNPDEILSSSPGNGASPRTDSSDDSAEDEHADADEDSELEDDDEDTAMSLVSVEDTGDFTLHSEASDLMSDSSARLDAALRQATVQATTQRIQLEDQGDMTMDMVTDDTVQVSPWAHAAVAMTPMAKNLMAVQEQENINPFSPAFRAHAGARRPSMIPEADEDASMDMTRAMGTILPQPTQDDSTPLLEDDTMELTQVVGQIRNAKNLTSLPRFDEQRTPEPSPERPAKRRRTSEITLPLGNVSFEPIPAPNNVSEDTEQDLTMDMTMAIGSIRHEKSPSRKSRRSSVARRRSIRHSVDMLEPTMELTAVIGSIKPAVGEDPKEAVADDTYDGDDGMEMTVALGSILPPKTAVMARPSTPDTEQEAPRKAPMTPTDQGRFREVQDMTAKKLLTPVFEGQKQTPESRTTRSSSKRKRASTQSPLPQAEKPEQPPRDESARDRVSEVAQPHEPAPVTTPVRSTAQEPDQILRPAPETPKPQSPLSASMIHVEATTQNPESNTLSDNLRILSTPRKTTETTPAKRAREMTPKRTPAKATPRSTMTPRSIRSNKRITAQSVPRRNIETQMEKDIEAILRQHPDAEAARLNDFVKATGLNFMDLKTNKRDLISTPSQARRGTHSDTHTLETAIVASACSVPELSMYEHSCEQLTHFISEGKSFLHDLEQQVKLNATPLLRVYGHADAEIKARFDDHIKAVRSKARNESKQIWYGWRSQLLENVEQNLQQSRADLELDADLIAEREALAAAFVPDATREADALQTRVDGLEAELAASSSDEQEALRAMRARLAKINASVLERQTAGRDLESAVSLKEQQLDRLREAKSKSLFGLQEARRLQERLRSVSLEEVSALANNVSTIERGSGWVIDSVHGSSVTMTHRDLQLFFDTSAFSRAGRSESSRVIGDRPISLVFAPNEKSSSPLQTERRFFLQLLQAHVQSLVQSQTRIADLLDEISSTWTSACTLQETLRKVRIEHPVSVQILSDERLGVEIGILLPRVQTKVCVDIEICASVSGAAVDTNMEVVMQEKGLKTEVQVKGRVVYGEQYKESAIAAVIRKGVGSGLEGWEAPVRELREKLIAFGRKT